VITGAADVGSAGIQWPDWLKIGKEKNAGTPDEIAQLTYRVVGRDVLHIIVHPDVPLEKLEAEQYVKIFTGVIKNWKEVGGKDIPVVVVLQNTYPATNASFKKLALENRDFASTAVFGTSVSNMVEKIAKTPGAIGFTSSTVDTKGTKV